MGAKLAKCQGQKKRSASTVNWQLWLRDSRVKLSQLAVIVSMYVEEKESGHSVELDKYLRLLQWYWLQQEQRTQRWHLSKKQRKLKILRTLLSPCEYNADTQNLAGEQRIQRSLCAMSLLQLSPGLTDSSAPHESHAQPLLTSRPLRRANSSDWMTGRERLIITVLYDVMLEAVVPTAAIFQQADHRVRLNQSALSSGQVHRESGVIEVWILTAGSTAEGLCAEHQWGHEWPDIDGMFLYGAQLGVCVTHEHTVTRQRHSSYTSSSSSSSSSGCHGDSCLEYEPEGCPPAYTRLRVTDHQALLAHPDVDASCMVKCDGHYWLLSTALNEALQRDLNQAVTDPADRSTSISGPAGQAWGGLVDFVPALVANKPHPAIVHYINRLSSPEWPSHDQQQQIQQLPMNLVLVGHKESPRKDQEFRHSWSTGEMVLISPLPHHIKQGYIAFKYVMKYFLKMNRGQNKTDDGRSKIGSYHFKTTFLYHLENTPPSKIDSPYGLMMDLFRDFINHLNHDKLPHYFLPECDLLATVGHEERQIARKSIHVILLDPISAVLKCPSVPTQIYGGIHPGDLVTVFHQVSTHPCCERSRDELLLLLSCLDEWRQQCYRTQLGRDNKKKRYRVSGRPELRGLVRAILEQTKHMQ